ncbi:hypothetical protein Pmani_011029 [Petrolisthes manimaculis]|uniref:Uncharacterized protein n=1 Tax=Petrolisthes manimaculis TaxID=1843537 RepID=A0AAE1Q1X5_9EUCA|nr:hypothetical protein Pmani_011029 [Petrolisthes manimaculis]
MVYKRTAPLIKTTLKVHIDTGASNFYMSKRCLNMLGLTAIPRRVYFAYEGSHHLESGPVYETGNDTFDIVMGRDMMSHYRCVIDYEKLKMYFHVGKRVIKANLYT